MKNCEPIEAGRGRLLTKIGPVECRVIAQGQTRRTCEVR